MATAEGTKNGEAITPQRAREALKAIVGSSGPVGSDHWAVAVMTKVLAELATLPDMMSEGVRERCRGCHEVSFTAAFATEHFASCPRHPAVARAVAVRSALRLAPSVVEALHLAPIQVDEARLAAIDDLTARKPPTWGPGWFGIPTKNELRGTLDFLSGSGRAEYPSLVKGYVEKLETALSSWERSLHRELDPCPWCGAVVPLGEIVRHLEDCKRHPAAVIADEATAALAASLGKGGAEALIKLVSERDAQIDGLRDLIFGCCEFDGELGWNGEEAYARDYVEKDLERATSMAVQRVGARERGFHPNYDPVHEAASGPAFARPVWRALLLVGAPGQVPGSHAGTNEDVAALRAAATELAEVDDRIGPAVDCPACRRPGVWIERAVEHVATCLRHPAVLRRRAVTAELQVAGAILSEGLGHQVVELPFEQDALQLVAPDAFDTDEAKRKERRKDLLVRLLHPIDYLLTPAERLRYPSIVGKYRDDLAGPLSAWQRYRVAESSACPFCGAELALAPLLAHLMECALHPDAVRSANREAARERLGIPLLQVVRDLRDQADRARIATARLLDYVGAFKGTWGEDERCRATVPRWAEPGWYAAIQEAKSALAELEADRIGKGGNK